MIKIYIVDDHPFVREGLKAYLGTIADIEIVGEAENGRIAMGDIAQLNPDIAIIDLRLPDMNGIEISRYIRARNLFTKVIILSSFSEPSEVKQAMESGISGYLMKDTTPSKVVEAIYQVAKGEPVLHPKIARLLMSQAASSQQAFTELTPKETEVLSLLAKGTSTKDIAKKLYVSESTIKTHLKNIFKKLDVNDRTQAILKAMDLKIIQR
ncbi:MAG: response regulator transcription factor [Clostridia bacterium]|nr:response regulator transcription factor [Clostridia bacterium]